MRITSDGALTIVRKRKKNDTVIGKMFRDNIEEALENSRGNGNVVNGEPQDKKSVDRLGYPLRNPIDIIQNLYR